MFNKILVPTDGSELSEKAIRAAVDFAKSNGGTLVGISVTEPFPYSPLMEGGAVVDARAQEEAMHTHTEENVRKIAEEAAKKGVPCVTHVAESFNPYEEIIRAAQQFNCDIIFMASHGRKGLSRLFVGSETQKVLAHSTVPVLVFR